MGKSIAYNRDGTVTLTENGSTLVVTVAQRPNLETIAAGFFSVDPTPPLTNEQTIAILVGQMTTKADTSSVPTPATAAPPSVSDTGALGNVATRFAMENHTHASKARKEIKASSSATLTWVYPTAFGAGVVPICSGIAQVASGTTDLFNVQLAGVPTNSQCVFQINRITAGLFGLITGALGVNPNPASINLHLLALEP